MTIDTSSSARTRRRRLPHRYSAVLLPMLLTLVMTCIVSCISTLRGIGFVPEMPGIWMQAWLLSWLVAFPIMTLVLPMVRRVVGWLVEPAPQ